MWLMAKGWGEHEGHARRLRIGREDLAIPLRQAIKNTTRSQASALAFASCRHGFSLSDKLIRFSRRIHGR